jgi:hypothetical protein
MKEEKFENLLFVLQNMRQSWCVITFERDIFLESVPV